MALPALLARFGPGLPSDRRGQRLDRRHGGSRRGPRRRGRARAAAWLRGRVRRRPAGGDVRRRVLHGRRRIARSVASSTWSPPRYSTGTADLVLGARQPTPRRVARPRPGGQPGPGVRAAPADRRHALTDLGPMRAARRVDLLDLGITDRRFGWPLEMVLRAAAGAVGDRRGPGARTNPASAGRRSPAPSGARCARSPTCVGCSPRERSPDACVVIAKAPVAGRVKTRCTPPCSPQQAAALAERGAALTRST